MVDAAGNESTMALKVGPDQFAVAGEKVTDVPNLSLTTWQEKYKKKKIWKGLQRCQNNMLSLKMMHVNPC